MNRAELSLMIKANLGDLAAKESLINIYELKLKGNNIWLVLLVVVFLVGLYYGFSGGIIFWFAVLYAVGNRYYLHNQLKRARAIGDRGKNAT